MKIFKYTNILLISTILISVTFCGCKKTEKKTRQSNVAKKKIISEPSGAKIFHNGSEIGTTPTVLTASPQAYTVKLVKHGYKTRFASFTIQKGKNTPSIFKLEPASSSVLIESTPSNAAVIRDGKNIGETPIVISDLAFGNYSLTLKKSGHSTKDISFTVDSERPQKITANLLSNIGSVSITSYPRGAKIYHNGKMLGITPFNGEFPDGTHTFELKMDNYAPVSADITINKGKKSSLHRILNLLPGSFYITSNPSKARVSLNGKYIGVTPLTIKDIASSVDYKITVSKSGYATVINKRKTSPGRREPVHFDLKRNRGDLELVINPPGVTVYIDNIKKGVTQPSESAKISKVLLIKDLTPGEHILRYAHSRAKPESKSRKINIVAGEVTRPGPMHLWIPNAEIVYTDDSTEAVIILSQNAQGVFVEPHNGIRYTILRKNIKKINYLNEKE